MTVISAHIATLNNEENVSKGDNAKPPASQSQAADHASKQMTTAEQDNLEMDTLKRRAKMCGVFFNKTSTTKNELTATLAHYDRWCLRKGVAPIASVGSLGGVVEGNVRDKNTGTSVKSGTIVSSEADEEYDIDGVEDDISGYGYAAPPTLAVSAYQHDDDDIDGVPLELSNAQQSSFGGAVDDDSMEYDDDVDGVPL